MLIYFVTFVNNRAPMIPARVWLLISYQNTQHIFNVFFPVLIIIYDKSIFT